MSKYSYKVNGAFLPKGSPIENAKERLAILNDAIGMLNEWHHSSSSRLVAAMGFYNTFYTIFELIMQGKKKSPERLAYEKWKMDQVEEFEEFESLYSSFRNLMTHQGAYIPASYLDWRADIMNDTEFPVKVFPKFIHKMSENGGVIAEYTLQEWAVYCINKIAKALAQIEATAGTIHAEGQKSVP